MNIVTQSHSFKSLAVDLFLGIAVLAVSAGQLQATVVVGDDAVFGPDSIVVDTTNMMDWLDIAQSTNRSFSDVAANFGTGGDFEGWSHATTTDLNAFFTSAGFPVPPNLSIASSSPAMVTLINNLGITFSQDNSFVGQLVLSEGYYDDGGGTSDVGFAGLRNRTGGTNVGPQHDAFLNPDFSSGGASSQAGNWLVRSTIPEPASLVLLGLGGFSLFGLRRCSKKLS